MEEKIEVITILGNVLSRKVNLTLSIGVARRSKHRLKRRKYINCGPNYVWHIDGNDKLKLFGFCIHAGINGFSRKILWLKVSYTNNDPLVFCYYYLDAI